MMFDVPVTEHHRLSSLTVAEAHRVMQVHIDCPVSVCPIKQQAKARLVAERRMVPADRPHMGF